MNQSHPPVFGALIIGDEILSGRRVDKHLPKLIELLSERGLALSWAQHVGDDPVRITRMLSDAFASGDVVFSFGGIGATPDDHTRQCAAAALKQPLVLHPQAKVLINSPAVQVIRWAQSQFPALLPGGVVDNHPLIAPPVHAPRDQ